MTRGPLQPSTRAIFGIGLMLFAAVLLGAALHHLIRTGTCSSTGYNQYGPTQVCPAGTGAWIGLLMFGIFAVLIGAAIGGAFLFAVPVLFIAIGVGSITVAFDNSANSGAGTFGAIFGGSFFAAGALPALFMLIGVARRARGTPPGGGPGGLPSFGAGGIGGVGAATGLGLATAIRAARAARSTGVGGLPVQDVVTPSPQGVRDVITGSPQDGVFARPSSFAVGTDAPAAGSDVYDKISRLAELHKSGALTDNEFEREKAKLLNEL